MLKLQIDQTALSYINFSRSTHAIKFVSEVSGFSILVC